MASLVMKIREKTVSGGKPVTEVEGTLTLVSSW